MPHSRSDRTNPGIKRPYLQLPETLEGEQSYCITIPGGLGNKKVLLDLLQMATYWFSWELSAGTEGKQAADAWRDKLNLPELEMCCCDDRIVLHRVTEDGAMEISTDGGATWTPDPADPRINGTSLPNTIPGTGEDKKCNGATNAISNFKDAVASFGHSLTTQTTVIGLALAIAGEILVLLFSAGTLAEVIVPLIITTAATLIGVLEADYLAEFTEEVWETLLCDIFCTIGSEGQFTESQLINLQAKVDTDFSDNVALTFQSILRGWGTKGLNNACISGVTATSDCSDCDCGAEWCYEFDFSASDGGWEANFGTWESGTGWVGVPFLAGGGLSALRLTFPSTASLTSISVHSVGSGFTAGQRQIDLQLGSDPVQHEVLSPDVNGDFTGVFNQADFVPFDADSISLFWGGSDSFDIYIDSVIFRGVGVSPFPEDNCV